MACNSFLKFSVLVYQTFILEIIRKLITSSNDDSYTATRIVKPESKGALTFPAGAFG